jgi:hypothetical protein
MKYEKSTKTPEDTKKTERKNITGSKLSSNDILPRNQVQWLDEPLRGEAALKAFMRARGTEPSPYVEESFEFWVKTSARNVFRCEYYGGGFFDATWMKPVGEGEDGNNIYEEGSYHRDGAEFIQRQFVKKGIDVFQIPGEQEGGITNAHCIRHYFIFGESDDGTIEDQKLNIDKLAAFGIAPSVVVHSGGKSLHTYFSLREPVTDLEAWKEVQRLLIIAMNSDLAIQNYNREMRLPGFDRPSKGTHQEVVSLNLRVKYSLEELKRLLVELVGLVGTLDDKRWKKYVQLRNKNASAEVIREFIQTEPVLEPAKQPKGEWQKPSAISFKVREAAKKHGNTERGDSDAASLSIFISEKWQKLINEGEAEGSRHSTGFKLAGYLLTVASWLDEYNIPHANDAEELLWEYCHNSWDGDEAESEFDNIWGSAGVWDDAEAPSEGFYLSRLKQWLVDEEKEAELITAVNQRLTELNGERSQRNLKRKIDDPGYKLSEEQTWLNQWNPVNPIVSTAQYLSQDVFDKIPTSGIVNVAAPMGVGKSTLVKLILQREREKNPKVRILSLTPTRSIGKAQAHDWDIVQRDDIPNPKNKSMKDLLAGEQAVSIPFDSLRYIDGKVDVLILDEWDTGLTHAMFSSTVAKNGGHDQCSAKLRKIVTQNPDILIISLDANLSNPVVGYLQSLNPALPVTNIISERKALPWNVDLYADSKRKKSNGYHSLNLDLDIALEQGKNVCISTDSQAEAEALEKTIIKKHKKKVLRIDSTTAKTKEIQDILSDINGGIYKDQYDVFIFSPTLGQGASITLTKDGVCDDWEQREPYFDIMFGYFVHLSPFKVMQMLGRVRHAIPRKVHLNTDTPVQNIDAPTTVDEVMSNLADREGIALQCFSKAQAQISEGATAEEMGAVFTEILKNRYSNPELKAYAQLKARENYQQQNRGQELYRLLTEKRHNVTVIAEEDEGSDISDKVKGRKAEVKLERAQAVAKVDTSGVYLEDLQRREKLDYKQQRQREALMFEKIYPGLTSELGSAVFEALYHKDVITDRSVWLKAIQNDYLLQHPELNSSKQFKELQWFTKRYKEFGIANIYDLKTLNATLDFIQKHGLRKKLLSGQTFKTNDPALVKIFEPLTKGRNAKKLKELFGINVKAKRRSYIVWAEKILETFGHEVKEIDSWKEEVNGKRQTIREFAVRAVEFKDESGKVHKIRANVLAAIERRYSVPEAAEGDVEFTSAVGVRHPRREAASNEIKAVGTDKDAAISILSDYGYYPSDLEHYFEPHEYQALIDLLGNWVNECHGQCLDNESENQWSKEQLVNHWDSLSKDERANLADRVIGTDAWDELTEEQQEELEWANF